MLLEQGCQNAQGTLISAPLSVDEFIAFYQDQPAAD